MSAHREPVRHPNKTAQDNQPVGERQRVRDADWRRNQPSDKRSAKDRARAAKDGADV